MTFTEAAEAIQDAKNTIYKAEGHADFMAGLLQGRLKALKISTSKLIELKKELRKFNIHTQSWSE